MNQNKSHFNNYNGITSNSQMNSNFFNFDKGFTPNHTLIEKVDFKNPGNLMHNNVADNMLLERVTEYQINIDSNDRKISVYPNPFKFTVIFGGVGPQQLHARNTNRKNSEIDDTFFEGSPAPVIDRKFKNVKYIKIDFLMLPKIIRLCNNNNNYEFEYSDTNSCHLTSFGYLILRINELSSSRILGTNTLLSDNSFILYPDKSMGNDYVMWVTSLGSRIFNNSNLGNLDKLTISILTPSGKQLSFTDSKGKEIDFRIIYKQKRNEDNSISFNNILEKLRCYISIIIGVVENEINTHTKFEN